MIANSNTRQRVVKYHLIGLRWLLVAGLGLLPLVVDPRATIPFEVPKVWFFWLWVEVMLVWGVIGWLVGYRKTSINNRALLNVVGLIGVMVAASILGSDWPKSVVGNYYRIDGLLTLFHLVGLTILILIYWQREWRDWLWGAVGVGLVVMSGWAVVEAWLSGGQPSGADFGQPNFLGGYLAVGLPVIGYFKSRLKWGWWMVLGVMVAGIVATQSRGALVTAGVYGLMCLGRKHSKMAGILAGGLVLLGVGWYLILPRVYNAESRERILTRSLIAWSHRPVLGWGVANVDHAIESVVWPLPVLHDVYVDKAHSTFLEMLVTTGVVGLGVYLLLIMGTSYRLWRKVKITAGQDKQWWLAVAMLWGLYIVHSQTNVISINEELLFWLVVGLAGEEGGEAGEKVTNVGSETGYPSGGSKG